MISLIVAMSENHVIGINNQLPWHLPDDLKHFKQLTLNKPIIMGRNTFESIGKPLPHRKNIIVTRDQTFAADGCFITHSIKQAIAEAGSAAEIMIIGGANIYQQTIDLADRLYLTVVHTTIEGDAYFPEIDNTQWQPLEEDNHLADDKHSTGFSFITLTRV